MLRPGQVVVLCVLALLTLGVIMVNSAGMSVDPEAAVTFDSILLSRSTVYMALAMAAMVACAMLPIRRVLPASWLAKAGDTPIESQEDGLLVSGEFSGRLARTVLGLWPMWILVALLLGVLATVYLPGIGRTVNGSSRWISLPAPGLESIQPSELAKWAMVAILAWYGAASMHRMHKFWRGLLPGLVAGGALAGFIVIEDLGTGVLLGCVACVMLIAAGAKVWQLAVLAPAPLTLVALAISASQYRRDRLLAFLDPYADADGIGYHMIQSMVAVANGEVAGRGLGHGLQKFGYLPEDRTDFLFAIICEELGVAGALMVVALYGGMLWSCWTIIRREQAAMLKLLGLGVVATVGIQALINLAVVTGLGPTKGIALPLLSSGGTGWILTAASLGLIVAMDRTQDGWMPKVVSGRLGLGSGDSDAGCGKSDVGCGETEETTTEHILPAAADDHSRWAPPGLFAAITMPTAAEEASAVRLSEATAAAATAAEDAAMMATDGDQGLLFAPAAVEECDEVGEVAAESVPEESGMLSIADAETLPTVATDAFVVSMVDADHSEPTVSTIVEPSGFDVEAGEGLIETISTVDGPTEQLVVSLEDEPTAMQPEVAVLPQAEEPSFGRHV